MFDLKPARYAMGDFNSQPISVCGKSFVADQTGALYWGSQKALIISDLHLEKGSSYAARGQMLPPYDTRASLMRLAETIDRYDVECVIALGDSLHDAGAAERIGQDDLDILRIMQEDRRWIWVTGNHDPAVPAVFGGEAADELSLEGLALRHIPQAGRVTHEIAGHLHPAAKLSVYGSTLRRPCFVGNGLRLVLPAFGAFTGGLNVLDDAFVPLFGCDGLLVWMLGQEGLYPVATRQLRAD
jgi:uncharacterized protein